MQQRSTQSIIRAADVPTTPADVPRVLSPVAWTPIAVISIEYLTFAMRGDNHGEGLTMATRAAAFHHPPPEDVVELGVQVEICG